MYTFHKRIDDHTKYNIQSVILFFRNQNTTSVKCSWECCDLVSQDELQVNYCIVQTTIILLLNQQLKGQLSFCGALTKFNVFVLVL